MKELKITVGLWLQPDQIPVDLYLDPKTVKAINQYYKSLETRGLHG